jgi:hypothetical protein
VISRSVSFASAPKADVAELYGALLKARKAAGFHQTMRARKTGWPRVSGADSPAPPISGGKPAGDAEAEPPKPAPTDGNKVARIGQHRHRAVCLLKTYIRP